MKVRENFKVKRRRKLLETKRQRIKIAPIRKECKNIFFIIGRPDDGLKSKLKLTVKIIF